MFYNKDIFEECGLDSENPPQTWSEFLDACKTITAKGGNPYIGAQPWMGISATCESTEAAALYLTELFGEDYQSKVKEVTPNLGLIVQGVMAGTITDIDAAPDTFSEDTQVEWERAVGEAGIDISKFEFSDWDPMTDYDYAK